MALKVLLDVLSSYWLQNWLSYGHPKRLDQKFRGILGTCANQYQTSRNFIKISAQNSVK